MQDGVQDKAARLRALFDEGYRLRMAGRFAEAEQRYSSLVALEPGFAEAHANLGVVLQAQGKLEAAVSSNRRAVALRPADPAMHYNLALALHGWNRNDEAVAHYRRAIVLKPDFVEAHCNLGSLLNDRGDIEAAIAAYDRALAFRPDHVLSHYKRGFALQAMGRSEDALAAYERAIRFKPDYVDALNNRGILLRSSNRFDEALASFDRALGFKPDHVEALVNKGNTLFSLKQPEAALGVYDRALALDPNHIEALNNRGNALLMVSRLGNALADYERALALKPDYVSALVNRASALTQRGRLDEALGDYARALTFAPDHAEAHWGESLCRLRAGDFRRGWEKYEWRWRAQPALQRLFSQPLWLGQEDLSGKTILLHAEQGYGDTLQFCRYTPLVAARGARVVLEVQPALKRLAASLDGVAEVYARGEPLPSIDMHCPLVSLPLAFGTTLENVPAQVPYLGVAPELAAKWRAKLESIPRPRIGLAWSGRTGQLNERHRSIPSEALAPLLGCGGSLVSLQKDYRPEDSAWLAAHPVVLDFSDTLEDFADTAALASLMDVVVSIDTSTAHLAGALGLPLHVLLSAIGDWRWLMDRSDSPWYPTARLHRQTTLNDWDALVARVAAELKTTLGASV